MTQAKTQALIDIGANLTHDSFDSDRDAVMARAQAAGVVQMILTGTTVAASEAAAALSHAHPGVLYATVGMHPHHASDYDDAAHLVFATLAKLPQVVAVGECGLDYFRNFSPPDDQKRAFIAQLELAVETQLPVFLHQRDAHADFVEILQRYRDRLKGGVAHCFTGGRAELDAYLELDLSIGVTGWVCDERRGQDLRSAVLHIPDDRLMIETDAPYLLPRDLSPRPKSRRNEPVHLPHILAAIAKHRDCDVTTLGEQTTANARQFFDLPAPQTAHSQA